MSKKIHEFNDIIRKLRKDLFGKGPESDSYSVCF